VLDRLNCGGAQAVVVHGHQLAQSPRRIVKKDTK
jgi:hypothetical protein